MRENVSIINSLQNVFEVIFPDSKVHLIEIERFHFSTQSNNVSKAINNRKNSKEEVNVIYWFDEFWVYFDIKFIQSKIFLSLSVFQGSIDDDRKTQLFRAEWDNYDDNLEHAQPHWHIYPFKYNSQAYDDFETFIDLYSD